MGYICMIVDSAYPNDIRVRKEAESLAENNLKILVVCPKRKNELKEEVINGVNILRIGENYTFFKKGIYDIIESIFDLHPLFYFGLKKVFKKYAIDFLHVHDLPLAGTGYKFNKYVNRELILDLHENYPEALKTWFSWRKGRMIQLKNKLFFSPASWKKKEKKYCEKYDKVICVVDEMKEKLMRNFDINREKLVVISNYEKKEFSRNFKSKVSQDIIDSDSFSITYVGGFGPHRGLDTAIKSMPFILKEVPNAKLFLVGRGSRDVEETLKALVQDKGLNASIQFVGYRPFNEVATLMKISKLNIIPHKENEHTNNTIPHKLFQIMMSRSLLLVSSCKPLKRIVEKYDAGLVFEADNEKDFADKVILAYKNYEEFKAKTERAFKAVMNSENWETENIKLLNLYDAVIN